MNRTWIVVGTTCLSMLIAKPAWTQPEGRTEPGALEAGRWVSGGGFGAIGSTPDGTAIGMHLHADYFVDDQVSVGPLLQLSATDDMALVGLSAQGTYWVALPGTGGRGKLALQSGIGVAHADFRADDTSWLVPIGIGCEYTLDSGTTLNATSVVNFTNLHTGAGSGADVMPAVMLGMRF